MAWSNNFKAALSGAVLYPARKKPLPMSMATDVAIYPAFSLPAFSVQGPGYIYGGGNGPYLTPPFPQSEYMQAQVIDGLNGIVYGGQYQQSLIDMRAYLGLPPQ